MSSKDNLRGALENGRLPHAMLFSGPEGAGQVNAAVWLCKMLFCRDQKKGEPCGICGDCRLIDLRQHPDLVWLKPEEDSRAIKVDGVRAVIGRANLRPLQAPAKYFVIEPADAMNDVAQNAFLKTLEEPEGHTFFILISYATEKLLSTIRSRSQEFRFNGIPVAVSDEQYAENERAVMDFLLGRGARTAQPPDLTELSREEVAAVLDTTIEGLREALLVALGAEKTLGALENRPRNEALNERFTNEELVDLIEILAEFKEKIRQNVNTKLALSVLWEKLCPLNII